MVEHKSMNKRNEKKRTQIRVVPNAFSKWREMVETMTKSSKLLNMEQ